MKGAKCERLTRSNSYRRAFDVIRSTESRYASVPNSDRMHAQASSVTDGEAGEEPIRNPHCEAIIRISYHGLRHGRARGRRFLSPQAGAHHHLFANSVKT
ncbi:hypothetical protein M446_1368 [Methylobacterium sp. 4-46]|nr:hypothetical protein M446_1368 [Methylobacterium sp. 4-46]